MCEEEGERKINKEKERERGGENETERDRGRQTDGEMSDSQQGVASLMIVDSFNANRLTVIRGMSRI